MNSKIRGNLSEIVGLAFEISSNEENQIDVQVTYRGAVNELNLKVYKEGFFNKEYGYISETFYLEVYSLERTLDILSKLIEKLKIINETGTLIMDDFIAKKVNTYCFTEGGR